MPVVGIVHSASDKYHLLSYEMSPALGLSASASIGFPWQLPAAADPLAPLCGLKQTLDEWHPNPLGLWIGHPVHEWGTLDANSFSNQHIENQLQQISRNEPRGGTDGKTVTANEQPDLRGV